MLLRSTISVYPGIHLLTFGATCCYLLTGDGERFTLTNPGSSAHVSLLTNRLAALGISLKQIERVVITSIDAAKLGGFAILKRLCPNVRLVAPKSLAASLTKDSVIQKVWAEDQKLSTQLSSTEPSTAAELKSALVADKVISDGDTLDLGDDVRLRCIFAPGYQNGSVAYLMLPQNFLITDELLGFYRGRELVAPGCDAGISAALNSLHILENSDLTGIGLPYGGAITGALAKKHIEALRENLTDIQDQVKSGLQQGIAPSEIREQLREAFYSPLPDDIYLAHAMQRSFQALYQQVLAV
jgi:glyoxylase-like metal-dependent hydrolase (beta-lactamase superfamily II)